MINPEALLPQPVVALIFDLSKQQVNSLQLYSNLYFSDALCAEGGFRWSCTSSKVYKEILETLEKP